MPAGVAPAGSANGEVPSSVRLPPLTANAPTLPIRLSSTYRKRPSGLSRASTAPTPPGGASGGRPGRVSWPSWVISTQQGAVCWSANGEAPIGVSVPLKESANAETVPVPAPTLWALDTNSWLGLVGRNSLPNGPSPWAGNGEPGAAVSLPSKPTVKLSITEVPASVPASLVPVPLNSTSAGAALVASVTVDAGIGSRRPLKPSRKPV